MTVDDLTRRSRLGKTICKQAIVSVSDQRGSITHNDRIYYYIKAVTSSKARSIDNAYISPPTLSKGHNLILLAGFDEYFLGYKDRSIVADTTHYEKMFSKNGIFFPLIIQNGQVAGARKRRRKKETCIFDIQLLPGQKVDQEQVKQAAQQYAALWGIKDIVFSR